MECASENETRQVLKGACLDVSNDEAHYVVGTDGHQLHAARSFLFDIPKPLIVLTGKFIVWPGLMEDGAWNLRAPDQWVHSHSPSHLTRIMLRSPGVKTILEALPLLTGGDKHNCPIVLEVVAGDFIPKAKANLESACSKVAVEAKVECDPVETSVNRDCLSRVLRFGLT